MRCGQYDKKKFQIFWGGISQFWFYHNVQALRIYGYGLMEATKTKKFPEQNGTNVVNHDTKYHKCYFWKVIIDRTFWGALFLFLISLMNNFYSLNSLNSLNLDMFSSQFALYRHVTQPCHKRWLFQGTSRVCDVSPSVFWVFVRLKPQNFKLQVSNQDSHISVSPNPKRTRCQDWWWTDIFPCIWMGVPSHVRQIFIECPIYLFQNVRRL